MRLYSRTGATAVDHGGVHYEPAADGGYDFPGDLSDHLHGFAVRGEKLWETDIERQHRLIREEMARRADPATLLGAVEKLVAQAEAGVQARQTPAKAPSRAKTTPADGK